MNDATDQSAAVPVQQPGSTDVAPDAGYSDVHAGESQLWSASYADFSLPAGVPPPGAEHDAAFREVASELGMSQERAQDVYVLCAALMQRGQPSRERHAAEQAAAAHAQTVAEFVAASKFDREFGGERLHENLAVAKAAMNATSTPELRALLETTGLGNNAEVIRHFLKIAPAFSQSKWVSSGRAAASDKDASAAFYPTMT